MSEKSLRERAVRVLGLLTRGRRGSFGGRWKHCGPKTRLKSSKRSGLVYTCSYLEIQNGNPSLNQGLSERHAAAVKEALVKTYHIAPSGS